MKTIYKFPGILRWYEVIEWEVECLCPIQVAIDTLQQYNSEFQVLMTRTQLNPKLYCKQLTMRLQGIISAAVQGGITKYHEVKINQTIDIHISYTVAEHQNFQLVQIQSSCKQFKHRFQMMIYPITRRQILRSSKLKEFADDNFKFDENGRKLSK